jgi:hypothetical protein
VTSLVRRYHDEAAPRGRDHRVIVAIHPSVTDSAPGEDPARAPEEDQAPGEF